jgi:cell division septum initiation protein DivIVA
MHPAMNAEERDVKKKVASLARKLYEKEITYQQFMRQVPETDDEEVAELLDLITHEPKRGGWFGASAQEHDRHMEEIFRLIRKFEVES